MRVRVTKLRPVSDLVCSSLPVDYWVEGELTSYPMAGRPLTVFRDIRNGVKVLGLFQTSTVTKVKESDDETLVFTTNSVYRMEKLEG